MLTLTQNIIILIVTVTVSMLFMAALNRIWPREKRQVHNDLIGWQLNILGTTYAVILGFMLYTVWTDFGSANLNVTSKPALSGTSTVWLKACPNSNVCSFSCRPVLTPMRSSIETGRRWPATRYREESHDINQAMWKTLMSVKLATPSEITAEDHALSELSMLTEHRRTRLLQSAYHLPTIFWGVLLIGGFLTITSASMFGSANPTLHALQVFSFTLLITLVLLAIADVNLPFRGWVPRQQLRVHQGAGKHAKLTT